MFERGVCDHREMKPSRLFLILLVLAVVAAGIYTILRPTPINNWPITNASPSGDTIVAFGDSLTEGHGVAANQNYPAQLERALGKPVVNAGVSGNTTGEALQRLDRDVLALDPRIVLICLGGNDMLRRQPREQQFANLRIMIERLHQAGALVILIGIEGDGLIYPKNYGDDFRELARETGCVYVPNLMKDALGHRDRMVDPTHPNAEGYRLFVERLLETAGEYLER